MVDRHPQRGVGSGLHRNPPIGILCHLAQVGRDDHKLRARVPGLGDEVDVGRAGHVGIGAHGHDILRVVPVGAFAHVSLVAPDFGEGVGQVGVPVVEAHVHAAEELQEARTGGVREIRHGRDGREAEDAIRPPLLGRVETRGRNQFLDFLPLHPPEAAFAARLLKAGALRLVLDQRTPGFNRVGVLGLRLAPQIDQRAARVGVLDADGAVDVPRGRDAALAAARFVGRQVRLEQRVIGLLHLPGDDAVLDVDRPRAAAGAVDAVRRADDVVVLPAVAVELLPLAFLRIDDVLNPTHVSDLRK